jgi:hypothetical protein
MDLNAPLTMPSMMAGAAAPSQMPALPAEKWWVFF